MEVRITGETPIEDLEIKVRLQNCLFSIYAEQNGKLYDTYRPGRNLGLPPPKVKDFAFITDAELLRRPNFGRKSLMEWKDILFGAQDLYDPAVEEEELAGRKAIKDLRYLLQAIAAEHKSLARNYEKIADIITPLG